MKFGFFPKLAWVGIRKNKRLYTPYILTCMGMVMMFYIIAFLNASSVLKQMSGGDVMGSILGLGRGIVGFFALIFLFYTNSFLIRRRKKEFGLYNILGMGKWNLARILFWETLIIAVFSLTGGLLAGISLSKFAELGMMNLLKIEIVFDITIEPWALWQTLILFAVIFSLILFRALWQIQLSNPIELLHSEAAGEKPPRANWLFAFLGAVLLGMAYYLAVTIEDPIETLIWFFVAVIMVITATYLLFVAGSVVLCRILQKRKNYYYKTHHFVSVSSMVYRMKRNGAGLASICILCTMVLVMISSTVCLYIGTEDSLRTKYPRNISILLHDRTKMTTEFMDGIRRVAGEAVKENGQEMTAVMDCQTAAFEGYLAEGHIFQSQETLLKAYPDADGEFRQIYVVPLEDYNKMMGKEETLRPGEVLIGTDQWASGQDTIVIGNMEPLKINKVVTDFKGSEEDAIVTVPALYIFVPDFETYVSEMEAHFRAENGQSTYLSWYYGFDLDCDDSVQIQIQNQIQAGIHEIFSSDFPARCSGVASVRTHFYELYGSLFFLGILLGIVFLFAAVLMIYYKQISEGYEDQSRFEIMQKVGMTKKEIRRSINAQILTVFFLPLLTAGMHLAFAFPMIYKMLMLFGLTNERLLILVTGGCYLIFALFYVFVYQMTSRAYYSIVSGARD